MLIMWKHIWEGFKEIMGPVQFLIFDWSLKFSWISRLFLMMFIVNHKNLGNVINLDSMILRVVSSFHCQG